MQLYKVLVLSLLVLSIGASAKTSDKLNMTIKAECSAYGVFFDTRPSYFYKVSISNKSTDWFSENQTYLLENQSGTIELDVSGSEFDWYASTEGGDPDFMIYGRKKALAEDKSNIDALLREARAKEATAYETLSAAADVYINSSLTYNIGNNSGYPILSFDVHSDFTAIDFGKFIAGGKIQLKATKTIVTTKKIKEEIPSGSLLGSTEFMNFLNEKARYVEPKIKYRYVNKDITTYKNSYFDIVLPENEWNKALSACKTQISEDKKSLNIQYAAIAIGILIVLIIVFIVIRAVIKLMKRKAVEAQEKYKEFQKKSRRKKSQKDCRRRIY